jgi:hypothetical protein
MKNIVTKATWLLFLASLIHLATTLILQFFPQWVMDYKDVPDTGNEVIKKVTHIHHAGLNLIGSITFLAGITALALYVADESKMTAAIAAVPLLFVTSCLSLWSSAIMSFEFSYGDDNATSAMLINPIHIPMGLIANITGYPGAFLLWYAMYKAKLFSNNLIATYMVAYFLTVATNRLRLYNYDWFGTTLELITDVLFIYVYFSIARKANTPSSEIISPLADSLTEQNIE